MNKIDEIVIGINKEKRKTEAKQEQKPKKNSKFEYNLNNWLLSLKEKMAKRAYKKVIRDITSADLIEQFKTSEYGYKIIIIYIQAKLKVIENKIFKYHIIENEKFKHQINRCLNHAKSIPNDIKLLHDFIPSKILKKQNYYNNIEKRDYIIEFTDNLIRCYFDYIYTMALFNFKINKCEKSISYLTLGLRLFKTSAKFILSSHSLFKAEKCFILLSKIYITNEDYESAMHLLNDAIKICFKQIIFQVHDIYSGYFIGDNKDFKYKEKSELDLIKDSRMNKIILNIVILFLYNGICHENMSNIRKASAFYKQCEWFTKMFLSKENRYLYRFILRLKKNSIDVCNIIYFLQAKIIEVDKKLKRRFDESLREEQRKKKGKSNLFFDNKFKKLVEKLGKLKIKEIDTVNRYEKSATMRNMILDSEKNIHNKNFFLSNMKLLEAYLAKDFTKIIDKMKKINLFDLDSMTRDKIQKVLDKMYFRENQKKLEKEKFTMTPSNSHIRRLSAKKLSFKNNKIEDEKNNKNLKKRYSKLVSSLSDKKNKLTLHLSGSKFLQNQLKCIVPNENIATNKSLFLLNKQATFTTKENKFLLSSSNALLNSSLSNNNINNEMPMNKTYTEKNTNTPKKSILVKKNKYSLIGQKISKSNYFLNFKYLRKRNYIKKLGDRELNFQKCLIRTKKAPIPNIHYFSKGLSQIEADNSFMKIKTLVSNININSDWKENMSEKEYKDYLLRNKLENTFLSSLNNNALEKYKSLTNKKEKELDDSRYEKSLREADYNNKSTFEDLTLRLNYIYENEQKRQHDMILKNKQIQKELIKRLYRNNSFIGRNDDREDGLSKRYKFSSSASSFSNTFIKPSY